MRRDGGEKIEDVKWEGKEIWKEKDRRDKMGNREKMKYEEEME